MYTFGPVPSRRLGISLGVNNIPAKVCSYSCVYCQVGRTTRMSVEREAFYDPLEVIREVVERLKVKVDVVTIVPDGEPTLDVNLGKLIRGIKEHAKVAVITNGSLLFREDVRQDLSEADVVSVKVDSVREATWRRVNRPHPRLKLEEVLQGIRDFSREYRGVLMTETMLVKGLNDSEDELRSLVSFLSTLRVDASYIAIPIRPPAERWVRPPDEETLVKAYALFSSLPWKVELLAYPEGPDFKAEDPREFILSTTAVHPLRLEYAERIGRKALEELLKEGKVKLVEYMGVKFVVRRLDLP